jgi:hypothetical protein
MALIRQIPYRRAMGLLKWLLQGVASYITAIHLIPCQPRQLLAEKYS